MSTNKVTVAVVSVFRPDEEIFHSLDAIRAICPTMVIVDDGSPPEFSEILNRIETVSTKVVRQSENSGLAEALNVGCAAAISEYGATHLLTFDQDTQPDGDYLIRVLETLEAAESAGIEVGLVCAGQNNQWTLQDMERTRGVNVAVEALQSGFLIPVTTFDRIGNFRSSFFIDCIDIEYMFRARKLGLESVVADEARIAHTVGDRISVSFRGRQVRILGKRLEFSYHGPFRRYYITRNRLILFKEYGRQHPAWARRHFLSESKIALLCFLFGKDRAQQVFALVAGVVDGLRGYEGKMPSRTTKRIQPRKAAAK